MEQNFETCLYNVVDAAKIQKDEPMKKHTTFRIGGPADYFIMPSNEKELAETIRVCREFSIPIYIVEMEATFWLETKASEERLSSFIRVWEHFR